jgi:hypothetical protein
MVTITLASSSRIEGFMGIKTKTQYKILTKDFYILIKKKKDFVLKRSQDIIF